MLKPTRIKIFVFEALQVMLFILTNFFSIKLDSHSQNVTLFSTE